MAPYHRIDTVEAFSRVLAANAFVDELEAGAEALFEQPP